MLALYFASALALDGSSRPSTSMSGFGSSMLSLTDASILVEIKIRRLLLIAHRYVGCIS